MPSQPYDKQQAAELFNADWAVAASFDTDSDLSSAFNEAVLVALHNDHVADAYLLILYRDYPSIKEQLNASLASLKFK